MALRDDIAKKFGPKKDEAFALIFLNELNIIRLELGLPPRTDQQLLQTLLNHVNDIQDYDWMHDPP